MFGSDDEFGYPAFSGIIFAGLVAVSVVVVGFVVYKFSGYKFVKPEPAVNWVQMPFTQERNQAGQTIANIYVGFDDKGYMRWTRQEIPQAPAPAVAPTAPAPAIPAAALKPMTPQEKKFVEKGKRGDGLGVVFAGLEEKGLSSTSWPRSFSWHWLIRPWSGRSIK